MSEITNRVTMNDRLGQLYATPIGHDTLSKVLMQLNISDTIVTKGPLSRIKLKTLAKIAKPFVGEGFFDTFLNLINSETDTPFISKGEISHKWWKEAVFYQIYPRSFYDSNGDGIGDLRGIIEKLDYLKDLGVDALWLSPIYDSPNDDNGYDIRDYRNIMQEFGTMEDFDELLSKVHEKGMRLIMDLVINHTSDEHPWFKEALANPDSKYRDYYFFRPGGDGKTPPNNWNSFFAGPAWNYYPEQDVWALHLFSKKQMDLNWESDALRADLIDMINWWLDKGVDGFRMDVINYISKQPGLPDGNETVGKLMGYYGIEHYYYGPKLHQFLAEVQAKAFAPHGAFSVGETPGIGMNMCRFVTGEERKELDMVFSFDHLETPGHVRMDDYEYDLNFYRDYMIEWMDGYGNNCWMSIFFNNHDNPRMISKISKDPSKHSSLAKLLATMQLTLKGTPFIFQGDEMGLSNYDFTSMDQITDVEAKGYYAEYLETMSPEAAFRKILCGTREHCRVLLPWNTTYPEYHAGLTQEVKKDVFGIYQKLIALRHREEALVYGDFNVIDKRKNHFTYERRLGDEIYVIDCNLSDMPLGGFSPFKEQYVNAKLVFSTLYNAENANQVLLPYEARIWKL